MIEELKTDCFHLHYKSEIVDTPLLWESHCHATFEMIAVLGGGIVVGIEGRQWRLGRGESIVIPPLCYHTISAQRGEEYERLTVLFEQDAIPTALQAVQGSGAPAVCMLSGHVRTALAGVCREADKAFYAPLADSLMVQALYELSRSAQAERQETVDSTLVEILAYIDRHLGEQIVLDDLAAHVSRSKSSVCHLFVQKMKISPKQYILQKKLAHAALLIKEGVAPCEVATRLGYENYSNFYRLYKKHFGRAPTGERGDLR